MNTIKTIRAHLSRRVGPSFADMAIAADAVAYGYPDGWGTSPRRAPSPAKAYKPTHDGGYPRHACLALSSSGVLT